MKAFTKDEINEIIKQLNITHANPVCELNFSTPFELLIAVILSAQCTDKRVNEVTKELFKKYNTPVAFANADVGEIEKAIYTCGFYHNKASNIIRCSRSLLERFNGEVPKTIAELETLEGVGRKTANVVYAVAFGGQAIAVDTHVLRLSNRIGFVKSDNPKVVEEALMKVIPQDKWTLMHHLLIHHGRYVCNARKPNCENCAIANYCQRNI